MEILLQLQGLSRNRFTSVTAFYHLWQESMIGEDSLDFLFQVFQELFECCDFDS
jgi:hypothetical protein